MHRQGAKIAAPPPGVLRAYPKTSSPFVSGRVTTGFRPRPCASPISSVSATPHAGARRELWMGPVLGPAGESRWRPAQQVSRQVLG